MKDLEERFMSVQNSGKVEHTPVVIIPVEEYEELCAKSGQLKQITILLQRIQHIDYLADNIKATVLDIKETING